MGWKLYYNSWEEIHGFFVWGYHIQSNPNDFDGDSDDDGLSDKEEMDLGLNPIDPDTDCDGLLDFVEINGVSEHSNLEQVGSYEWNREYGVNHNSLLLNVNKEVMAIDPNDNENDKLIFYEWPGYPEKICPKYSDDLHKEYQWIADGDNIQDQKDVAIGDFDMDGYIDEVVSIDKSPHGTDNMIFYEWNWDQDNTPEVIYNEKILPPFDNQIAIAVGDFNNDGYLNEIVTIDDKAPGEQDHLIFYRWQDYPVFSPEFLLRWEITGTGYEDVRNQKDIAVGDFDEDGFIDDIVTIDDDNGNDNDNLVFYEWKNYNEYNDPNSDLYHNSNALPTPKEKWDISGVKNQKAIAVCDLDNDGYLNEIVTIDDNGEGNDNLVFYDFPNYPNFWPEKILKWDIPGDIKNQNSIAVGDFDADGHIDDIVTIDDDASDEDNLIFYHWDKDDYLSYRDDDNLDKLPELVQKWENIPDANDQLGIVVGDFKQIEVKGHSTNTVFCNIPTTFWGEILPEDGCENPSDYTWTWDFDIETDTPDFATDDIDNDKDGDVDEQDEGELVDWDGDGITDNDGDAKGQFPTYTYKFNPDLHYPHTYKVKVTSSNGREGDSYPNNGETFNIIVKDITTESKLPDSDFNGLWDGDEYLGDRFLGDKLGLYNSLVCEPISQNRFNGYNFDEYSNPNHYITNPKVRDTDGDGISDRGEMDSSDDYTTHPLIIDTDGDTLPDGWLDINGNGQMDLGEFEDRNRDGYVDIGDWSNGDGPGETNPTLVDTDGGGDSDDFELSVGLDPLDYYSEDPDKDGLTSFEELNIWGPYPCPGGVEQRSHMLEQNWDEDRYLDSVDPNPLIENDPPLIYNLVELDRWVYGIGFSVDEISNYEVSCTVWVPEELEGDDCPLEISSDGDDWEILFPVFLTPVEGWYTEEALIRITDDSNHDGEYNYDHTDDIPDDNYCTIHMIFDPGNGNLDGGETTISDRFWAASDISWAFSDTPPVPSRYHNIGLGEIGGVFGLLFGFIAIITDEGDIVEPDISLSDQYIWKFKNTQGRTIFLERGFIEDKVVGEDTYYRGYGFDYIVNGPTAPYIIPPENEDLWTISLIHIIKNILSESNEVETDYVGNQIYHYRDVNDDDWQLTISNGIIIDLLRI